jgi:DNA-directed RNA polymerase specialized sigma24 family protein
MHWTDAQLARLSPRQREVLQLVDRDGLSIAQVAENLGIAISTTREHLAVARARVAGAPHWTSRVNHRGL